MSTLAERSKLLAELNEKLRQQIETIEMHLRTRLSTRVTTGFSADGKQRLAFGKLDGKWRLIIITIVNDHEQSEDALVACSQVTRSEVLSGGHIERLLVEAVSQLDSQIADREFAINKANALLDALLASNA